MGGAGAKQLVKSSQSLQTAAAHGPARSVKASQLVSDIDALESDRDDVLKRLNALNASFATDSPSSARTNNIPLDLSSASPNNTSNIASHIASDNSSNNRGKQQMDSQDTAPEESKRDFLIRTGKLNPLDNTLNNLLESTQENNIDQGETVQNLFQGDYEEEEDDDDAHQPVFVDDGDEYHYQKRLQRFRIITRIVNY